MRVDTDTEAQQTTRVPTHLAGGRYTVRAVLGRGGMATVYRVFDQRLQVERALKVLSSDLARSPAIRRRFETEASTMARLAHPNIAGVFDVGEDGDDFYMVMELVEGGSLADYTERHGPLPPRLACEVTRAVLGALQVAHDAGVVHRDIKPHNVLLARDGTPKVTDFGIARVNTQDAPSMTRTGSVMGTWAFMPPEQRAGARGLDGRADVYACGAMLVSLVAGDLPGDLFVAELHGSTLRRVPEALRPVIVRATRYLPEDRFDGARSMADAVLAVEGEMPPVPEDQPRLGEAAPAAMTATPFSSENNTLGPLSDVDAPSAVSLAAEIERHPPRERQGGRIRRAGLVAAGVSALAFAGFLAWRSIETPTSSDVATTSGIAAMPVPPTAPLAADDATPSPPIVTVAEPVVPATAPPRSRSAGAAPARKAAPAADPAPATGETVIAPPDPVAATGRIGVVGDAAEVWFSAGGDRFPPGEVPAGNYVIEADWGTGVRGTAGKVVVSPGEALTVSCDAQFMRCRSMVR